MSDTLLSGRYQMLRPLAEGGMAELWLAKLVGSAGFAKLVAVKRILPQLARSARFADMFLDEGRIAADLRHPNVVQVLEAGAVSLPDGDELFIAMELLEGLDAGRLVSRAVARGERLPPGAAVQIALDAAEGLAYAHGKQSLDGEPLDIVHRDVSPQNIFVTVDGHAKVVDFGIAKARSQTTMTEAGTLKGKCAYMSPEQVCGDPFDHRADQFALGVVLWELITGLRLFRRGSDVDTLRSVLQHDVLPPSTHVAGIPGALDDVVMRALSVAPEDRYPSCEDLAAALDDVLFRYGHVDDLRGGARVVARLVRARLRDRDVMEPATSVERTLPERVFLSGVGVEVTSVEGEPLAFAGPPPKLGPAPPVIGRAAEIAAVDRAFADVDAGPRGPVTLVGPAGAGKSQLARAIAAGMDAPGGAFVVEMEGAESEADVVTLFAFALGLPSEGMTADADRAGDLAGRALAARGRALVVLDGIDAIRAAAAPLARALSAHARVLATARAPLEVGGERVVDVGPLTLPAEGANRAQIAASPAVALLVEAAGGAAVIGAEDPQALAAVARGAGGLPSSLLLAGRWLAERRAHAPSRNLAAELERRSGEHALAVLLDGNAQGVSDEDRSALWRLSLHRGPLDRAIVDALVPERDPADVMAALRKTNTVVGDELVPAARDRALDELAGRGVLRDMRIAHASAVAVRAAAELARLDTKESAEALAALERLRPACDDAVSVLLAHGIRGIARIGDSAEGDAARDDERDAGVGGARGTGARHDGAGSHEDDNGGARGAGARADGAERDDGGARDRGYGGARASVPGHRDDDGGVRGAGMRAGRGAMPPGHREDDDDTRLLILALALDAVLARRATPASHLRLLDDAIAGAGRAHPKLRARALEARADHMKLAGKADDARRDYLLALDLSADDAALSALLHRNIADLDLEAGNLVAAEHHARRAVADAKRAQIARLGARATWTLGRIALKRGVLAEAEILLERAAAAFEEERDTRFAARASFELGRCAEARGDALLARARFSAALAGHEAEGDVAFAERARVHLGVVVAWLGDAAAARGHFSLARASAAARGDSRAEAMIAGHLADLDAHPEP